MKQIKFILFVLFFIKLLFNVISSAPDLTLTNYTIVPPFAGTLYGGIVTPFMPDLIGIAIYFKSSLSDLSQYNAVVNYYDQNGQFIVTYQIAELILDSIPSTTSGGTSSTISPSSGAASILYNNSGKRNSIRYKQQNNLKVAQNNLYTLNSAIPTKGLSHDNTFPEYLTFDLTLSGGQITFTEKIYLNAPAYNFSMIELFSNIQNESIVEFGDSTCRNILTLDANESLISNSYGIYFMGNSIISKYTKMYSIKNQLTSYTTKYFILYEFPNGLLPNEINNNIIIDGLTNHSVNIISNVECNQGNGTPTTLSGSLIQLYGYSSTYYMMLTSNKVNVASINSISFIPTSFKINSNTWCGLIKISSPAASPATISINPENLVSTINLPAPSSTPSSTSISITQISQIRAIEYQSKKNYTNSQILFSVQIDATNFENNKVTSVDYSYDGFIFYSDKEIISNYYKKLIYLPDNLLNVNLATQVILIFLNTETSGRVQIKTQQVLFSNVNPTSNSKLVSNQQMNLRYTNGNYYIKAFSGKMGYYLNFTSSFGDITQIPDFKFNYYSTDMTTISNQIDEKVYIESNFPFGYTGYLDNLTYIPSVPLMSDTPGSKINADPSYPYNTYINNNPLVKRDFINPNIYSNFTFSKNLSKEMDRFIITITDSIGISSIKPMCKVSWGTNVFNLLPQNIYSISDSNLANTTYQFDFIFNRYFCQIVDPIIDCTDIRGNNLYDNGKSTLLKNLLYTGIDQCSTSISPSIPSMKLMSIDYKYESISNVTFKLLFSNHIDNNVQVSLIIYDNYDNIGQPIISQQLNLDTINPTLSYGIYTTSILFNNNDFTSIKYISLLVKNINSFTNYTLSTKELEYLNKITQSTSSADSTPTISSQFIIRNKNYYSTNSMAIDLLLTGSSNLLLESDKLTFSNSNYNMSNIKNITFVIKNQKIYYGQYYYYNSNNSSTYQFKNQSTIEIKLLQTLQTNSLLYIESFCDFFNNCLNLGPYSMPRSFYQDSLILTPRTNFLTISDPLFSRNYIDISSNNRKIKVSIELNLNGNPFIQSTDKDPLFYVTERDSNDQISCQMKQVSPNSPIYQCDLNLPLMFGSRGLGHCSIYNLVYDDGYLDGKLFENCKLFLFNQYLLEPVLWEISTKMYDTNLYFYGMNLNLLDSMIHDKSLFIGDFIFLNSSSGYYKLKEQITKPMDIIVGYKTYSIFIYTCLKDNCSGNGQCNFTTLLCQCNKGWGGTDCSIDQTFTCVNNCSGNGICTQDKTCNCFDGFTGVSCEYKNSNISMNLNASSNSPSVVLEGFDSHSFNNYTKSSKYSVDLVYIQEVDIYGNVINKFNFSEIGWSLLSSSQDGLSNSFNTTLLEYSNLIVKIDIFKETKQMTWANELITIPENSIKYSVRIENYTFSSNLNKMEMYYQATPNAALECAIKQQIAWGAKRSTDMHWVTLPNNQLQLYGRFSNNLIIDDRIVSTSNEGLEFGSTIQVKVNIPFFKDYVELDPDFSVLVDVDMNTNVYDECGNIIGTKNDNNKWKLPVIVVVSVVGATIIIISIITIFYRKNTNLRLKVLSFKSKYRTRRGVSMKNF